MWELFCEEKDVWWSRNQVVNLFQNITFMNVVLFKPRRYSGIRICCKSSRSFVFLDLSQEVIQVWPRNASNRSVIFARKTSRSFSTKMRGYLVIMAKNIVPSAKLWTCFSVINEHLTRALTRECAEPRRSYNYYFQARTPQSRQRPSNVKVVGGCTNSEDYRLPVMRGLWG